MSLSIPVQPPPAAVAKQAAAGLSHLKAGDVLEARIVETGGSGGTVFQFAGFRAIADKPVTGGGVGDVVQFMVLPEENDTAQPQQDGKLSARLTSQPSALREARTGPSDTLQLRLIPISEKAFSAAPVKTPAPATPPIPAGSPAADPLNRLLSASLEVLSGLIQRFGKMRPQSQRSKGRPHAIGRKGVLPRSEKYRTRAAERPEATYSKGLERPGECYGNGFVAAFRMGPQAVRMKLQWRSGVRTEGEGAGFLTAVFALNLEGGGAVRVDVKMNADHLQAGFWVADDPSRRRIAEALPELSAALVPLAKHCSLHVGVAPDKILALDGGQEMPADHTRLDVRA